MPKKPDSTEFSDKKEYQRKKNRWFFEVMSQHSAQADAVDIAAPAHAPPAPAEKTMAQAKDEQITQHVQMIRNRVTGRRRKSEDRWNRFAGTAGAGGRGR